VDGPGTDGGGVPFVDLARSHAAIASELDEAFRRGRERGDYVLGEELELFEEAFAEYVGVQHCVGVASGTAALTVSLAALGIGPGDEVIVPAHTFIASALPVLHVGAEPVFCDVDELRGLVDVDSAAAALSERTVAIIGVHLYGQACDLGALRHFADANGIALIEDAAQAHGASWSNERVGATGTTGAFSFYPSKNLGALGDGGAITTDDEGIASRARQLRNLGQRVKGHHEVSGFNERLDTLQAAFLRIKLPHLDGWNEDRRRAAAAYVERLPAGVGPVEAPAEAYDVFHLFSVRVEERARVAAALGGQGIGTGIHYTPPVHQQPPMVGARAVDAPNSEAWAREQLSLPMFPGIREAEIDRVCAAISALI
jgi:dTDP-3-amino-3,4,6-trideoxy-alpha-D-glucose transaminase